MSVLSHLVNLVENEHRIRRTSLLHTLDDASRHGTDVSASMSSYLCLVVQTAQRYPHILALEGGGNALSERCFAHSRRTIKTEYGSLWIDFQTQHGDIFQDALLGLFQGIGVAVEHPLSSLQVDVVGGIFSPR